jgi:hypothetical protein
MLGWAKGLISHLAVLYHQPAKQTAKDIARREEELAKKKKEHGVD